MPKAPALNGSPVNRLLASLPAKEYQRLLPELEPVTLAFAQIIYAPGDTIRHVYFRFRVAKNPTKVARKAVGRQFTGALQ